MTLLAQPYTGKGRSEALNEEDTPDKEEESSDTANWEKRYRDLQSYKDRTVAEKDEEIKKLKEQLKSSTAFVPPKTKEEIDKFKEEYPDAYDLFISIAHNQASSSSQDLVSEVEELKLALAQERALAVLKERHPDYYEVSKSAEFHNWLEEQDEDIQKLAKSSTNGNGVARVLDLYKSDMGTNKKKSNSRSKDATSLVDDKNNKVVPDGNIDEKIWTRKEIEAIPIQKWEEMEPIIRKAQVEGRIQ